MVLFSQEIDDEDIKTEEIETNDAAALYNLGVSYLQGKDVTKDDNEATKYFQQAAENGHPGAQFALGNCYLQGRGIAVDKDSAAFWFQKAADQGHPGAQYALGNCYLRGVGLPLNQENAVMWFQKAAEQGHSGAQFNLATCYYMGIGISKNGKEAFILFQKAKNINARYLSMYPLNMIVKSIQKRPLDITPIRTYKNGYLCTWKTTTLYFKSDEEALLYADEYERNEYVSAKAEWDKWDKTSARKKNQAMADARVMGGTAYHPIVAWRNTMNSKLDMLFPRPKSDIIFVEGLPQNTLTDSKIDTVIYYIGSIEYNKKIIQRCTVNFQNALEISITNIDKK